MLPVRRDRSLCLAGRKKFQESGTDKKNSSEKKKTDRQVGLVDEHKQPVTASSEFDSDDPQDQDEIYFVDVCGTPKDEFQRITKVRIEGGVPFSCTARLDTGCPITLVQESLINCKNIQIPGPNWNRYCGINNSKLQIKGIVRAEIAIDELSKSIDIGVVPDGTMSVPLLVGRDALKLFNYRLTSSPVFDKAISELLLICDDPSYDNINTNRHVSSCIRKSFEKIFVDYYIKPIRSETSKVKIEATLTLKDNKPIQFGPQRLGFSEKEKT